MLNGLFFSSCVGMLLALAPCITGNDSLLLVQTVGWLTSWFMIRARGTVNSFDCLQMWRHGDRSPLRTYPNDQHQADSWPQGFGQLTTLGMAQHVQLGARLRQRYIHELGFLSPNYTAKEIHLFSTDVDRTLLSSVSNMIGLFDEGAAVPDPSAAPPYYPADSPEWPSGFVPIPVHTVSRTEDDWLFSYLSYFTGLNVSLDNAWWLEDTFAIEERWNKSLPVWATPLVRRQMANLSDLAFNWTNGIGLPSGPNSTDLRLEITRMDGGRLLWGMLERMLAKVSCATSDGGMVANKSSAEGEESCDWLRSLKLYAYAGHEINVAQLLASLNCSSRTNYDADGFPPFASCVTLELWHHTSESDPSLFPYYYVRAFYLLPDGRTEELTEHIHGCPSATPAGGKRCLLEQFIERSKPYRMEPTEKEYCANVGEFEQPSTQGAGATGGATPRCWLMLVLLISQVMLSIVRRSLT